MSVNTDGQSNENSTNQAADNAPAGEQRREHVQDGELANGGLDLPVGEQKSDQAEAERQEHHEWNPETGNQ